MNKRLNSSYYDRAQLRQAVLSLLARRDYSRYEIIQKYRQRVENITLLEELLDDFLELGYQSDQRFCEAFLNSRYQRYGPIRLAFELKQKGIAVDLAQQAMATLNVDWSEQAAAVLAQKYSQLDIRDNKQKAKAYRFLAQRGFASADISSALNGFTSTN